MKVLVATKEAQGQRKNDYSFVPEGELVCFGFECDGEGIDGSCGCRRGMGGMVSHTATTTFKVADLPMTVADFEAALLREKVSGGWIKEPVSDKDRGWVHTDAVELLRLADAFPVGVVLEKRGAKIRARTMPEVARAV